MSVRDFVDIILCVLLMLCSVGLVKALNRQVEYDTTQKQILKIVGIFSGLTINDLSIKCK